MQIAIEALLQQKTMEIANLLLSMTKAHDMGGPPMLEDFLAWDVSMNCSIASLFLGLIQDNDCSVVAKALDFIR